MTLKACAHAKKGYHLTAMATMTEFIARYEQPSLSVGTLLDSEAQSVVERNLKVIESLFKVTILCGKQGLALRGHRDDNIQWEEGSSNNEGNFIELVRFRAETDKCLADHLSCAPKNAQYTSKTIQNELIKVVGDEISGGILEEVRLAKFYSIIADEVTDASNSEVLSIVVRYVHDGQIREVFLDFLKVERITGRVLGEAILKWLRDHDISPHDMRGQCYDGASNMSGARSGVKAVIQEAAPKALYFHCAAHRLNLAIVPVAFKSSRTPNLTVLLV